MLPGTVLGFCAHCSTALLESDANCCRGCRRTLDPTSALSVASGIQMSPAASRNGMRPITWRLDALALLAAAILLWDGRFPHAFPPTLSGRGVVLGAMALSLWGFWSVLKLGLLMNHRLPVVHIFADWKKRLIVPLIMGLCVVLLWMEVPFHAAFAFSRADFEREAEAALKAPAQEAFPGAASYTNVGLRRMGLYWVDGVARHEQEVRFYGYLPPQSLRSGVGRYFVFSRAMDAKAAPDKAKNVGHGWWAW